MQASFDSCTVSISSLYITHSPSLSSSPPSPAPLQHLVHQPRHAASCVAVGGAEMAVDLLALAHSSNERTAVPLQVRGATALQVRGATALHEGTTTRGPSSAALPHDCAHSSRLGLHWQSVDRESHLAARQARMLPFPM